jgi:alpha-methylacyl-CoA racemase
MTNRAEQVASPGTNGPLAGLRIIELAGIGPTPFCGMMLADHGADVIRVERPGATVEPRDILHRSRRWTAVDLKTTDGVAVVRDLCRDADGLLEGFRPGVMERLGLGPEVLLADNARLVYGRMTGWGQTGPAAQRAGHDINYISLAGALHAFGRDGEKPTPPLNLVGDFGGGGMMLAFAMVAGILHASRTGRGQVIDCAMLDGAALQMSMTWMLQALGKWSDRRGTNILDTGAHFYEVYETSDGRYISIGCIEPQFYAGLRAKLGLAADPEFDQQMNPQRWPQLKQRLAQIFATRTRAQWCDLLEDSDVCFAPVLSLSEAPGHPHNEMRKVFLDVAGVTQPAPAPRFSRSECVEPRPPERVNAHSDEILGSLGYSAERIAGLRSRGVIS